ncbi:MAG: glycosyltransferase [Candidatus Sericytochromatia bacterium]|nr:glycosyltransferase [Candidatus Sericytochromatia bacterium]
MLVRNGRQTLPACLASVRPLAPWIYEWVFLDTGSDDSTPDYLRAEIPEARVLAVPWPGHFATARNQLLAEVSGPWLLMLDADEALAPESLPVLQQLLSKEPSGPEALACLRLDHDSNGDVFQWTFLHRLFAQDPALHFVGAIHERPCLQPGERMPTQIRPDIVIRHQAERSMPPVKAKQYLNLLDWARQHEPSPLMDFYRLIHPDTVASQSAERRLQQLQQVFAQSLQGPPSGQTLPGWMPAPLAELLLEIQQLQVALGQHHHLIAEWPHSTAAAVVYAESWVLYGDVLRRQHRLAAAETAYLNALDPYYSAADPGGGWQSWRPLQALAQLAAQQGQPLASASYAWQARHSAPDRSIPSPDLMLPELLQRLASLSTTALNRQDPEGALYWASHYLVHHVERQILWQAWQAAALHHHQATPILAALLHLLWPETRAQIPLLPALSPDRPGDPVLPRLQQALLPGQIRPRLSLHTAAGVDPQRIMALLAPVTPCEHDAPDGWHLLVSEAATDPPPAWLQQLQLLSALPPGRLDIFVWQSAGCHLRLIPCHLRNSNTPGIEVRLNP